MQSRKTDENTKAKHFKIMYSVTLILRKVKVKRIQNSQSVDVYILA